MTKIIYHLMDKHNKFQLDHHEDVLHVVDYSLGLTSDQLWT